MLIAWAVVYRDGSVLHCADNENDQFKMDAGHPWGGEVPFKAINWPEVEELGFYGPGGEVTSFAVGAPTPGYEYALRSRVFITPGLSEFRWFVLVEVRAGEDPTDTNVAQVLYWGEDGTSHQCFKFNCGEIAQYSIARNTGTAGQLMPGSSALATECVATLT